MPGRHQIVRTMLGLALLGVLLAHSAQYIRIDLLSRLDAIFYDARLRLTMPGGLDERIVIVDIDEKSLAEEGRWPWPRNRLAKLVDILFEQQNIRVLAFDVVFAETDRSSGIDTLSKLAENELRNNQEFRQALANIRPELDYDGRFVEAIKERPVVLGYYFAHSDQSSGALPEAVLPAGSFGQRQVATTAWHSYGGNLPELQAASMAAGYLNPLVDFDGIFRRVPLLAEYQGEYYEALALATVRTLFDYPPIFPGFTDGGDDYAGLEWLSLPTDEQDLRLAVDENVAALVPYRGKQGSFPYISASDLLHGRLPSNALANRIVLVGTSAPGLVDLQATPVGAVFPGVEVHANLIAGILDGALKHKPEYALAVDLLIMLLAGLMMIFIMPRLPAFMAGLMFFLLLLVLLSINFTFWQLQDLVMPVANSLMLMGLLYMLNITWGYFFEAKTKHQLTNLFGQYVPPELVRQMSKDPENYNMAGRKAELTVFFSDVRGFTTISENIPPEQLASLINDYLAAMTEIIRAQHGTLDKYIGDAIMAFWGAPVANPKHAELAVSAALAMQTYMPELNRSLKAKGWPELAIGMGINTGLMTVGDMGSPVRQSYTVMGDAVNLAARLESATKQYGVNILIGEATRAQLKDEFLLREIDRVRVKGKTAPITVYEPLALMEQATPELRLELTQWNEFIQLYRQQQWQQALSLLAKLTEETPTSQLYKIYRQRIDDLRQYPPSDTWDGVFKLTSK